jgi:hypothetical protein
MRIAATFGPVIDSNRRNHSAPATTNTEPARPAPVCALVPVRTGTHATGQTASGRPAAALLAQLVAGAQNLPASRARRRADPGDGARLYRAVADLDAASQPRTLRLV